MSCTTTFSYVFQTLAAVLPPSSAFPVGVNISRVVNYVVVTLSQKTLVWKKRLQLIWPLLCTGGGGGGEMLHSTTQHQLRDVNGR